MKRFLLIYLCAIAFIYANSQSAFGQKIPFSTNNTNLTIWNGTKYVPFFMKGINLGVSIPGTFPGELAAKRSQYKDWFTGIKEAGFNCIRVYTLHYPRFYEVLDSFNLANPQNPLLFIQGVWLNEELPGYNHDLNFMTDTFRLEIKENIDCVHGNKVIAERQGKAYGTYSTDASSWCLAYIIGREIHPQEVITTNENHPESTSFSGNHFSITNTSATEVWITSQLDQLVTYEYQNYNTQRPVSISSWPTLDPLSHPGEITTDEDIASINLSEIVIKNAPAGLFISYHAYPYYPDFISLQPNYQTYSDNYGSNSYKGYLTELKSHYPKYPLIIAEYGVPSSWGVAHYASSSMNHGGFDEEEQGNTNMRILETIEDTNCGGGIQFAWIDEWFKRTWITDPIDNNIESRVLWHNITAAEQNFGLISFNKASNLQSIKQFNTGSAISEFKADANYTFFELEIALDNPIDTPDELWVAIDTYSDELGESLLPIGVTIPFRSEFFLHITNYSANLYVTEAYDIFGIWHNISNENQLYHSIASDNAPWYLVRWKNNSGHSDVQYIGSLQVNYDFQNPSSKDAVTISDEKIQIRIPWSLLNVVEPNKLKVLDDYKNTPERENVITEGFNIGVYYKNQWFTTDQRFSWTEWNTIDYPNLVETRKISYNAIKKQLPLFNVAAIAMRDSFAFENESFPITVNSNNGLLKNDFDLDGEIMISLVAEHPKNGHIDLNNDGSFAYYPNTNFYGIDSLEYYVFDGYSLSEANVVVLNIIGSSTNDDNIGNKKDDFIVVYPNPVSSVVTVKTDIIFDELFLFNSAGQIVYSFEYGKNTYQIDISNLSSGVYIIVGKIENRYHLKKIVKN